MTEGASAASRSDGGHRRGDPAYRRMLLALFFAGVATFAQLYSPQALLPDIAETLGVTPATSALVLSFSTIGLAIGVLPWTVVSDRIGRVRAMAISIASASLLGALVSFADSLPLLIAGRFVEGLLVAGVPAVVIAFLSEEVHAGDAARAAGTYVAGTSIGGLSGRLIAGPVGEALGWRVGVLSVALVCMIAAAAFIALVPASRRFGGVGGLEELEGLGRAPTDAPHSVTRRILSNLRSPRLLALYAQGFLLMGGFVALYNYLSFRLTGPGFDLSPTLVTLIFLAYLAGTWSSGVSGGIAARRGRLTVLLAGIAALILGTLVTLGDSVPVIIVGLVIATAGFFAAHSIASGWTGQVTDGVGRAQTAGLYNVAYYAGSSLFGWLGGILFVSAGWPGVVVLVVGLAALAAGLALAVLRRPAR